MNDVIDATQMKDAVQVSLRAALDAAPWPRALIEVAAEVLAEPTRVLGGRLTPWILFPLHCCAAVSGDWRPAVPAAAAAELYAVALDLCDDIEDGDRSAAVERHGMPVALNVATALLALAHEALKPGVLGEHNARYRVAQDVLWRGLAVATGGQHLDLVAAGAAPLSVAECLDIARRKGGALVEACCRAGAALGTDDPVLVDHCGALGLSLGLLGQLDNDMHDADDGARKSDLARRKQTVPIAFARAGGEPNALDSAVWRGGIQLAYALVYAERARARMALDTCASLCPDPDSARHVLGLLLKPRDTDTSSAA